ncbi:MAG TPA: NAD(P)-binding domain-containing protein [Ignavibacteriaceae bacterium]|nr:NAD(P)-binding domain-containing protein [Ignavibacteriaceae bacterium]
MKIAVIGSGNIGGRLAKVWGKKGHRIFLGSRNPDEQKVKKLTAESLGNISAHTQEDAVKQADIILMAVPASAVYDTVKELGNIKGKIIIDAMNAIFRKPEPYSKTSEAIIAASGNDHIVKCFNSVGAENMDNPKYGNEKADMFLCGNYEEDKKLVKQLAEDCGFNVYDIGGIDKEPLTESAAGLWSSLAVGTGLGRNIAFKILKR